MTRTGVSETTRLLHAWANGDPGALTHLTPRVYRELRRIAGHFMRNEPPGCTMQATALVHEAYIRLVDVNRVDWLDRAHFFAVSAQMMRRVLLDAARKRGRAKRGGDLSRINLDEIPDVSSERGSELIALDDSLQALAKIDPRKAQIVELRYFGGMTVEETAQVLKISVDTVMRDWSLARAWLMVEMGAHSLRD
jgi:RNA polymerase sigma factor (TIGR02999 family)